MKKHERARMLADRKGEKYYFGETCKECGTYKWHVRSNTCVKCSSNEAEKKRKAKREAQENENLLLININKHKSNPMYQKWG